MPRATKFSFIQDCLIIAFGVVLLKTVYATLRIKSIQSSESPALKEALDKPCIFLFWHGRQLLMPKLVKPAMKPYEGREYYTLISMHRDGRLIAKIIKFLGLRSVSGSSTRGGVKALSDMRELIKAGSHIAITPDGPKGPAYKMKAGALKLAQLSGAPVVPVAITASKTWKLKSWDQMQFPRPFSSIIAEIGEPIYATQELQGEEFERALLDVEVKLNSITAGVDGASDA